MTLTEPQIGALLAPYLGDAPTPPNLHAQLSVYLDLLLRWNARTNLTAIRDPEEIVRRHFGESLFAGVHLAPLLPTDATLLDFGSGAGFPGLPIQLLLPELQVTLAESQGKKASFLREAARALDLKTEVWAKRVEEMPADRRFRIVILRAVDNMDAAMDIAITRILPFGSLAALGGEHLLDESHQLKMIPVPGSHSTFLYLCN
ncbi:MAG TPA: 16S rRNA (guanine(527)-N(7))-methyltransferase RsmG [Acidobacteriaceae bacterium]|nr:16S rRNA (guanine(527)-N(7))-methyltransferase RsmG [Acidobacteriaceae bacterium]